MNWDTIKLTEALKLAREISDLHENSFTVRVGGLRYGRYDVSWLEAQTATFAKYAIACPKLKNVIAVIAYSGELTETINPSTSRYLP